MTPVVKIGGHVLKFDFMAMVHIEKELGEDIWERMERGTLKPSFHVVLGMFWGGMHNHDETITLKAAAAIIQNLLTTMSIQEISNELMAGLDNAFPDQDEMPGGEAAGKPPAG